MMVLVAFTIGLIFWIVAWTLGIKAFDAFLVTILLTVLAATVRQLLPFINRLLKP
jgi:uncharacterized integral membrane protein